jgi:large conductance mechanosensitive channel
MKGSCFMSVSEKKIIQDLNIIKTADEEIANQFSIIKAGKSQVKDFLDFIRSSSVLGLAVGIVIGGAVGVMVRSLIDNVIMPPLGLLLGSSDGLKGLAWTMGKTNNGQLAILHYGTFLNDVINFIVIAVVVYLMINLLKVGKVDIKKK